MYDYELRPCINIYVSIRNYSFIHCMNFYSASSRLGLLLRSTPDCQKRTCEMQITATYLLTQFVSDALVLRESAAVHWAYGR